MKMIKLGEALLYEQPTKYIVNSDNYHPDFKTPVLTAGKSFILGYTNETEGIFEHLPVIIFDDFTTAIKFVDFPFKVKSSAMKILSANKKIADIKYMYYKMLTIKVNNDQHQRYWISKFANLQIPLPDLATQKAIASKLDKADEIRQLNKKLIEQYDALTQSLFLDMFGDPVKNEKGWEKITLGKITSKIGSGSTPRGGKESYKTEGISLIRSMNVYDNRFLYKDLAFIDDIQATKLSNVEIEKGDILFNITGASVCRCTIVPNNVLPARVNQHVSIIRIKQNMANNKFINYQLIFESTKRQLLKIGSGGGAVMEAITKEQLQKYQVINPPISLQNEFAERVKVIEAQKALAQQALQQSEDLFNSLLQESFQ